MAATARASAINLEMRDATRQSAKPIAQVHSLAAALVSDSPTISFGKRSNPDSVLFRSVDVQRHGEQTILRKLFSGVAFSSKLDTDLGREAYREIEGFGRFVGTAKSQGMLLALQNNLNPKSPIKPLSEVGRGGAELKFDGQIFDIKGFKNLNAMPLKSQNAKELGLEGFSLLTQANGTVVGLVDPTNTYFISVLSNFDKPHKANVKVLFVDPAKLDNNSLSAESLKLGAEIRGPVAQALVDKVAEVLKMEEKLKNNTQVSEGEFRRGLDLHGIGNNFDLYANTLRLQDPNRPFLAPATAKPLADYLILEAESSARGLKAGAASAREAEYSAMLAIEVLQSAKRLEIRVENAGEILNRATQVARVLGEAGYQRSKVGVEAAIKEYFSVSAGS